MKLEFPHRPDWVKAYADLILKLEDSDSKILTPRFVADVSMKLLLSILLRTLYPMGSQRLARRHQVRDFLVSLTNFHLFFAIVDDAFEVVDSMHCPGRRLKSDRNSGC